MRISRAAIRYSKASLEYAIEKKVTSIIKNDFEYILLVLSNSDELNNPSESGDILKIKVGYPT